MNKFLLLAAATLPAVLFSQCAHNTDVCCGLTKTLSAWEFSRDSASWENVTIPHSTNAIDGHSESYYRGKTYYKTNVEVSDLSKPTYLLFEGAAQKSSVYLNGNLLSLHGGGYTAFYVDVTGKLNAGSNSLSVVCDNTEDIELIPVSSDFNKNNGLHNEVRLLQKSNVHFDPLKYGLYRFNAYNELADGSSVAEKINDGKSYLSSDEKLVVKTALKTLSPQDVASVVCRLIDVNGNVVAVAQNTLEISQGKSSDVELVLDIPNAHLWNGKRDPYLYNLELEAQVNGLCVDKATSRYGFRHITLDPNDGFKLNGLNYPLRGVAVHQDKEGRASAMTKADYDTDYQIISELGANMVRLAHYPHNDYVFRLCDSLGLVVQTEIPWVNVCGVNASGRYFDNIKSQATEMTHNLMNHPSICFWGLWNELDYWGNNDYFQGTLDCDAVVRETAATYDVVRAIDPLRPIGVTDCSVVHNSGYTQLKVDFISENRYNGWYYFPNDFSGFTKDMVYIRENSSCKIVNASEYGVGINPSCHTSDYTIFKGDPDKSHHYEEYGNLSHESHWQQICHMPWLNFTTLWVMYDFAVANRQEGFLDSDDGINFTVNEYRKYTNDKGLVTRDRKVKKDVFYLYKAAWNHDVTTVHITNTRLAKWTSDNDVTVKVYSNANSLTLYLNGEKIQSLSESGEISGVIWQFAPVSLKAGKNTFRVVADDGTEHEWLLEKI